MPMTDAQHIVIDTNVLISAALLPHSKTAAVLLLALERYMLAQNQQTWHELQTRISRPKFDRYFGSQGRLAYMTRLAQRAKFFDVMSTSNSCRDPADNMFLALATDVGATIIVSGDDDLKTLHSHNGIAIYSPMDFLHFCGSDSRLE
jgi:putative PIN family toxin of toxin-antitoxin system